MNAGRAVISLFVLFIVGAGIGVWSHVTGKDLRPTNFNAANGADSIEPRVADKPPVKLAIGINLAEVKDWSVQWAFVDVFKGSRDWMAQTPAPDGPWDTGQKIEVNAAGWPLLKPGQAAATLMCREINGHYPAGVYVCTYEGTGRLQLAGDVVSSKATSRNRCELTVKPAGFGIYLKIVESDPHDPVRNLHVWMPGFENAKSAFHPLFVERLRPFKVIRFMNWAGGNNDPSVHWPDRTTPDSVRQSGPNGVAIEHIVDLCNELGADAWLCMPYQADDDYLRQYAKLVFRRLRPDLKVYVEWSNETWNGIFQQALWVNKEADSRHVYGTQVTAEHAARAFTIWRDTFGAQKDRIVRVAAGQHYNPWIAEQICQSLNGEFDAVSCAAYFSPPGDDVKAFGPDTTTKQVLDSAVKNIMRRDIPMILKHRDLADKWSEKTGRKIRMIAYEAGQHILPIKGFGAGDDTETAWARVALACERDPAMYDAYMTLFDQYSRTGGDLLMQFVYCDQPGKFGSWGALDYQDEPAADAPKYRALCDYLAGSH